MPVAAGDASTRIGRIGGCTGPLSWPESARSGRRGRMAAEQLVWAARGRRSAAVRGRKAEGALRAADTKGPFTGGNGVTEGGLRPLSSLYPLNRPMRKSTH
ncbi:hypothetical protein Apa02nite_024330 [Actinoplanes palleronii]|uniref:Uncharacterized protein n=1 Tax=Actinoplanes palleronii TaxID=113570 RepID=A0ABQ4B7S7_9ACTN|nr:hypothetical protein Apa02nite_024330 [Actinoplanes palleronii]